MKKLLFILIALCLLTGARDPGPAIDFLFYLKGSLRFSQRRTKDNCKPYIYLCVTS
jgi:hypothetical protein